MVADNPLCKAFYGFDPFLLPVFLPIRCASAFARSTSGFVYCRVGLPACRAALDCLIVSVIQAEQFPMPWKFFLN